MNKNHDVLEKDADKVELNILKNLLQDTDAAARSASKVLESVYTTFNVTKTLPITQQNIAHTQFSVQESVETLDMIIMDLCKAVNQKEDQRLEYSHVALDYFQTMVKDERRHMEKCRSLCLHFIEEMYRDAVALVRENEKYSKDIQSHISQMECFMMGDYKNVYKSMILWRAHILGYFKEKQHHNEERVNFEYSVNMFKMQPDVKKMLALLSALLVSTKRLKNIVDQNNNKEILDKEISRRDEIKCQIKNSKNYDALIERELHSLAAYKKQLLQEEIAAHSGKDKTRVIEQIFENSHMKRITKAKNKIINELTDVSNISDEINDLSEKILNHNNISGEELSQFVRSEVKKRFCGKKKQK